jgi:CoA:oxalate CoA-transferase
VNERIQKKLLEKTRQEWIEILMKVEVPCAPILSIDEVFEDPQVLHDDMKVEVQHPRCGRIPLTGDPVKLTPPVGEPHAPPPLLGQHTREVLANLVGLSDEELEILKARKII